MTVTRPILRYHGGKWKLAPWIIANMPAHTYYTEAFGGAASVLLRKKRSHSEVYNDLDDEVVNLFRVVREDGDRLIDNLANTPFARREFDLSYAPTDDPIEQARRTVIRGFMGFGSAASSGAKTGFRSQNHGNGTSCAGDWNNLPSALKATIERLRGVVIENCEAVKIFKQHDHVEALHYVDPPYVFETRRLKNPYCKKGYRHEMTDDDHSELAATLQGLKGMVMLSGYRCDLYDSLYEGWERMERNALADGARPRVECLWFNAAAARRSGRQGLLTEVPA